jgi:2-oxoglutarate dehydrogenase E2 component (dihydrolipoamide succinyltransferase)
MPTNVIMPQMGESIFEGTVTKWLKKVGDRVQRDEPLFEISTDKVDAEIPSPSEGVLTSVLVKEGQTVQINTVVAVLDGESGGAPAPAAAAPEAAKPATAPAAAAAPAPPSVEGEKVRSSPLVRKLAEEHQVDLRLVTGTGSGGRVSKDDILAYIAQRDKAPAVAAPAAPAPTPVPTPSAPVVWTGRVRVEPMSTMRAKIAERMILSRRTSAHVHTVYEVDMTNVVKTRERFRAQFQERYGIKLTYTPFFARAAVQALQSLPIANASVDGTNIVYHQDVNLGMAVALDWGLIVPVVHNAEEKNFLGLARAITDLAERARSKKLKPEEVQNSTFTITNPGVFGAKFGTPIINQPNVAIMGIGNIYKAPVVINDAIAIRTICHLTLGYDHRIIDGAVADEFLSHVKKTLEGWEEGVL